MDYSKAQKKVCQARFPMPPLGINVVWIGIFCFLFVSIAFARENNWQLALANGDTISGVSLQRFDSDSLAISFAISDTTIMKWISIDSIVELRKVNKSKFWKGAGIGLVTGATVGALIGLATYEEPRGEWAIDFGPEASALGGGILGAPLGFLLGGIIGSSSGKDEIFNFSQMSHQQKLKALGWILLNQKLREEESRR